MAGGGSGDGGRLAEQLVENAEQRVEELEQRVWSKQTEAHLGPAPVTDGEEATVWYFGYGSNMNKKVFEGRRMIRPAESVPAVLPGWRLTFNQPGLPYTEPSFAAVEPQPETAASSSNGSSHPPGRPDVNGVLHRITPSQWRYVLETEGASEDDDQGGYAVVQATAVTYDGREIPGVKTLTVPATTKARLQGRDALPSLRYMTLIREGAQEYQLTPQYQEWLATLQHYEATRPGQKLGAVLFSAVAFTSIFPVWAAARLFRKATGIKSANGDVTSRFIRRYTAVMFGMVSQLHELLRPVLGCGMTVAGDSSSSSSQPTKSGSL